MACTKLNALLGPQTPKRKVLWGRPSTKNPFRVMPSSWWKNSFCNGWRGGLHSPRALGCTSPRWHLFRLNRGLDSPHPDLSYICSPRCDLLSIVSKVLSLQTCEWSQSRPQASRCTLQYKVWNARGPIQHDLGEEATAKYETLILFRRLGWLGKSGSSRDISAASSPPKPSGPCFKNNNNCCF